MYATNMKKWKPRRLLSITEIAEITSQQQIVRLPDLSSPISQKKGRNGDIFWQYREKFNPNQLIWIEERRG